MNQVRPVFLFLSSADECSLIFRALAIGLMSLVANQIGGGTAHYIIPCVRVQSSQIYIVAIFFPSRTYITHVGLPESGASPS